MPSSSAASSRTFSGSVDGVQRRDVENERIRLSLQPADVEDLGFFDKGKGGIASLEGETSLTGRIPINTSGGLLAKGHPIGATGVAQLTECCWQLRG